MEVNSIWQIWKKGEKILQPTKKCNSFVDIFTVDISKNRQCGLEKKEIGRRFYSKDLF